MLNKGEGGELFTLKSPPRSQILNEKLAKTHHDRPTECKIIHHTHRSDVSSSLGEKKQKRQVP